MKRVQPWQPTAMAGPKQGVVVAPKTASRIIAEAKNPVIVMGGEINELEGRLLEYVIRLSNTGIPVVATAHSIKGFIEKDHDTTLMGIVEITNLLLDGDYAGINGKVHDLVIYVGVQYALANQMFSTLKNFGEIKSMSISKYFQPNADYSFANLTDDIWEGYLKEVCNRLEKKKQG